MGPKPPYVEETGVSPRATEITERFWLEIRRRGIKAKDPLIADILAHPENYGVKSPVRQEVMNLVFRTFEKMGFVGTRKGQRIEAHLSTIIKERQEGGIF